VAYNYERNCYIVADMVDIVPPQKQLQANYTEVLCSEFCDAPPATGRPKLCYKDVIKYDLAGLHIFYGPWKHLLVTPLNGELAWTMEFQLQSQTMQKKWRSAELITIKDWMGYSSSNNRILFSHHYFQFHSGLEWWAPAVNLSVSSRSRLNSSSMHSNQSNYEEVTGRLEIFLNFSSPCSWICPNTLATPFFGSWDLLRDTKCMSVDD